LNFLRRSQFNLFGKHNIFKAVSYLSPNLFWFYEAIANSISERLNLDVDLIPAECDPLEDPLLQNNQVDLAFICGLPLIRHNRLTSVPLQVLAAPIMKGDRYQSLPIYFSDIVVNADSTLFTFVDLKESRFCYNDAGSNSGYNLIRYQLIQKSLTNRFFSSVQQSGSHQRSLQWIVSGLADCAVIDSVVLAEELRNLPELAKSIRVIDSMRSPMPPIIVSPRLGANLVEQLQKTLLQPDAELLKAMHQAQVSAFTPVTEEDYAPIALAYDAAIAAGFTTIF